MGTTSVVDSASLEKGAAVSVHSPTSSTHLSPPFDKAAERRLIRKLDLRILPVLWVLYLVNFIDRANIGNAKIQGMEKELQLTGQRFNISVWVFNLGYLVAGIPLTVAFRKYGPRSLCVMMFCWGKSYSSFRIIGHHSLLLTSFRASDSYLLVRALIYMRTTSLMSF
jgi:hypothetical protein